MPAIIGSVADDMVSNLGVRASRIDEGGDERLRQFDAHIERHSGQRIVFGPSSGITADI